MSELIDCINNLSAKDIIKSVAKTANGTPFYLQTVGGGVSFLPTDLAGCVLWLRADLGITLNGSDVALWEDQSSAGYDFQQTTPGFQPAFQASVPAINNQSVVTFDGVDEFLTAVAGDLNESIWHIFFITDNQIYVLGRNTSSKDYVGYNSNSIYFRGDVALRTYSFAVSAGYKLCDITIDESGNASAWRNGVASGDNPQAAEAVEFDAIGVYRGNVAWGAGSVAEVIIYDNIKTGDDLSSIRNYLTSRYAL